MGMRILTVSLCLLATGCARNHCAMLMSWFGCSHPEVIVAEDNTIEFPQFYDTVAVDVGAGGGVFRLDGATLQAVRVAADDFLPLRRGRSCQETQGAHRYRVIRRDHVVFVYIEVDPERCGSTVVPLDGGAKYAISDEGKILRRVIDGEPEARLYPEVMSGRQDGGVPLEPGTSPTFDSIRGQPSRFVPPSWQDGGPSSHFDEPDGGSPRTL